MPLALESGRPRPTRTGQDRTHPLNALPLTRGGRCDRRARQPATGHPNHPEAKPLDQSTADATVHAIIGRIRRTDWPTIETALIAALHRDRSGNNIADGYPASTTGTGTRTNGHTSSTETAALTRPRHDEHRSLVTETVAHLETTATACAAMFNTLARIDEIAAQPAHTYTRPACAEPYCEDTADPNRKGRCEPCYRWRDRKAKELGITWSEVGIVPRAKIEERKAKRNRRRIHITGPLTGR